MIFTLNFAFLPEEKYLLRKALEKSSQVVNELGSSFCSQVLYPSVRRRGASV